MRQPALFISHGSPLELLQDNSSERFWRTLPALLPQKPRAVLCVSAHWDRPQFTLSGAQGDVDIQHDFYGFPEELYEIRWPQHHDAATDSWMLQRLRDLDVPLQLENRPLDHGVWVPLRSAWPVPDFPVYQLSLSLAQGLQAQWELGRKLRALRDEGVLIIGSGGITHNLRQLDIEQRAAPVMPWAQEFVEAVESAIVRDDRDALCNPWQLPHGKQCHPTVEHYAPLLVALGAAAGEEFPVLHREWSYGSLAVHAYGAGCATLKQSGDIMKKIKTIIPASTRNHWVGDGFNVRPVFAQLAFTQDISPFLMFDYAAPRHFDMTSDKLGVGPHPHRGFETVTIAYQGEVEHGDSVGNRGVIKPGDVQWMTAASGIVHEEFLSTEFLQRGGTLEMAQLWVNLPAKDKMTPPKYQSIESRQIPVVQLPDGAGSVRVIAGDYAGTQGVASTFSPVQLWDVEAKTGTQVELPLPAGQNAMLFVRRGKISIDNVEVRAGDLVILQQERENVVFVAGADSSLILLGGEPINEPIVASGPFVMNSEAEIRRAMMDYQSGQMGRIAV